MIRTPGQISTSTETQLQENIAPIVSIQLTRVGVRGIGVDRELIIHGKNPFSGWQAWREVALE